MLPILNMFLKKEHQILVAKQPSFIIGTFLKIKYQDKEGNVTNRNVVVVSNKYMERSPYGEYVRVFCLLKEKERTFYVSRMLEVKKIGRKDL